MSHTEKLKFLYSTVSTLKPEKKIVAVLDSQVMFTGYWRFHWKGLGAGLSKLRPAGQIRPRGHFVWPQRYFLNNERITYLQKMC